MKRYTLDMTSAEIPPHFPKNTPAIIPLVKGKHFCDYDIDCDKMPNGWRDEFCRLFDAANPAGGMIKDKSLPVGVDRATLPEGAVITRVYPRHGLRKLLTKEI